MRVALSEEHDYFNKNGYFVLENAISKDQLEYFKRTLNKLLDTLVNRADKELKIEKCSDGFSIDQKILYLKNINPEYISTAQRIISRTPEFFAINSAPDPISFMRSLYRLQDNSPVYIINNGIVFTCPNDNNSTATSNFKTDWHNDIFYTIPGSKFWQIWIPLLNNATSEIGTLIVCPGSHKDGVGKQKINIEVNYNNRYTMDQKYLSKYSPKSIQLNLGDILIFDSRLIHKSGENISDKVRCTMLGAYHDATTRDFLPVSFEYKYYNKTPEGYFYEIFRDENAKKIMFDDLVEGNLSFYTGV